MNIRIFIISKKRCIIIEQWKSEGKKTISNKKKMPSQIAHYLGSISTRKKTYNINVSRIINSGSKFCFCWGKKCHEWIKWPEWKIDRYQFFFFFFFPGTYIYTYTYYFFNIQTKSMVWFFFFRNQTKWKKNSV